jgi:carbamoyl-phosphate synthase small subunit
MGEIAKLVLEDGSIYSGFSLGAAGETTGEVCFNTSMTGYQEILTDPSYRGQIVAMTYPEIGNYGVNAEDMESERPHLAGFIVRAESRIVSNYRADASLSEFLTRHGVVGISGIDTRALVRRIRSQGAMRGIISTVDLDDQSLIRKANQSPGLVGRDLVKEVMPSLAAVWQKPLHPLSTFGPQEPAATDEPHIVCLDFGMKHNIARHRASWEQQLRGGDGGQTGWNFSQQWTWRPGTIDLRDRYHPEATPLQTGVRHLPGTSVAFAGLRGKNF